MSEIYFSSQVDRGDSLLIARRLGHCHDNFSVFWSKYSLIYIYLAWQLIKKLPLDHQRGDMK